MHMNCFNPVVGHGHMYCWRMGAGEHGTIGYNMTECGSNVSLKARHLVAISPIHAIFYNATIPPQRAQCHSRMVQKRGQNAITTCWTFLVSVMIPVLLFRKIFARVRCSS